MAGRTGGRLSDWRKLANLAGPEVANRIAALLGAPFAWADLRALELGHAMPDRATADASAAVFEHSATDLLGARTAVRRGWPPTPFTADDLTAMTRVLHDRGHSTSFAERLFRAGASVGSAKAWLRSFTPEAAIEWLRAGFGPAAAAELSRSGIAPDAALRHQVLGLDPTFVTPEGSDELSFAVWIEAQLLPSDANHWSAVGWDLSSAIPWAVNGYDAVEALEWRDTRLTVFEVASLGDLSVDEARRWRAGPIEVGQWQAWRRAGFPDPTEASSWYEQDFSPELASSWRVTSLDARTAAEYRAAGATTDLAARWWSAGLNAEAIRQWGPTTIAPEVVVRWMTIGASPSLAADLARSGIAIAQAERWTAAGVPSRQVESWAKSGLPPEVAREWTGYSVGRVRRFVGAGITVERLRERSEVGAAAISAARESLASDRLQPRRRRTRIEAPDPESVCTVCWVRRSATGSCLCD